MELVNRFLKVQFIWEQLLKHIKRIMIRFMFLVGMFGIISW